MLHGQMLSTILVLMNVRFYGFIITELGFVDPACMCGDPRGASSGMDRSPS